MGHKRKNVEIHTSHTGSDVEAADSYGILDVEIHTSHTGSDVEGDEADTIQRVEIHTSHTGSDQCRSVGPLRRH